jgi:hypothetical protein
MKRFILSFLCLLFMVSVAVVNAEVIKSDSAKIQENQKENEPVCGDGKCTGKETEDPNICPQDCEDFNLTNYAEGNAPPSQPSCPDGQCTPEEAKSGNCPSDCTEQSPDIKDACGDGTCQDSEKSAGSCPKDCESGATDYQ